MYDRIDPVSGKPSVTERRKRINAHREPVGKRRSDNTECQPENCEHNEQKHRDRKIFVRQHIVDLHAPDMLFALLALLDRLTAHLLDKCIAHIRERRVPVKPAVLLHLGNTVFHHIKLIIGQFQASDNVRIVLHDLRRGEPRRHPDIYRMILHLMRDCMNTAVHRTLFAEIHDFRQYLLLRDGNDRLNKILDSLILCRADRDDRDSKFLRHLFVVDCSSVAAYLVHHIECKHHWNVHLKKLQGQIQISLYVCRIHNIDNSVGFFFENKIPCDDLLICVGSNRIDSREVDDSTVLRRPDFSHFLIYGHAGEIPYVLVRSCQLIKKRCFSAILIAC